MSELCEGKGVTRMPWFGWQKNNFHSCHLNLFCLIILFFSLLFPENFNLTWLKVNADVPTTPAPVEKSSRRSSRVRTPLVKKWVCWNHVINEHKVQCISYLQIWIYWNFEETELLTKKTNKISIECNVTIDECFVNKMFMYINMFWHI